MALGIEKIKRDFARHKKKAAILGVLAVVMLLLVIKAVFDMSPRSADASSTGTSTAATASPAAEVISPASAAETEDRILQSQKLWKTLREVRGVAPDVAFTFDPAKGFMLDPNRHIAPTDKPQLEERTSAPVVSNADAIRDAATRQVREQARSLIVRTTVLGSGGSKPIAVIKDATTSQVNERILGVGDMIAGFEITAIRAREVEFKKDGVTLSVKMADDARGQ